MDNTELLWKQYQLHIETYKFYLSITVKLITFYFAIAGAILSFYFANIENPSVKFALYLPWLMAMGLFIFFAMGAALSTVSRNDVFNIRDKLKLQVSPDLSIPYVFARYFFIEHAGMYYWLKLYTLGIIRLGINSLPS